MTVSVYDGLSNYYDDCSIFQGSNNVELILDVKATVNDAIEWRIHVVIPMADEDNQTSTTNVIWYGSAYQVTNIRYLIKASDLPVIGIYKLNAYVKWADGREIPGETVMLNVKALGE